jgi:exodeoxyribonuclease V alpha subunit
MTDDTQNYDKDLIDIKAKYKEYAIRDADLCKHLRSLGLGESMVVRVIEYFTIEKVHDIIKDNPFRLMEIEGFGFVKADNIARQLGILSEDPRRQRALIQSVLDTQRNFGNVFLPETILEKECKKQNVHGFKEMLSTLVKEGNLVMDGNRIYSKKLYLAECEVAEMLKERL